ncbi:bacillithiol system redox-active protein YtxJ [Chengkuizengella marina]|uniref:Bacillithiol system redox-active protein YtxJ n=1 Tax=Chengkuizengella marina TaxID=2507566 RepID=A0A6N9Q1N7_9BACL|nr:bacillithiol system redox-active protein YtxJ [Chengkuizengella marina]NBI28024.1 bacillithiol system redox-active protein YtxJ [Chengkuizengella marina]
MRDWKEITTLEQWKSYLNASRENPFVILKHSTTCPVSSNGLREFQKYLKTEPNEEVEYLMVKVIESRPVSNQIAEDLNVKHESPQVIYVKNREPYWNTSHWSITVEHMKAVLN